MNTKLKKMIFRILIAAKPGNSRRFRPDSMIPDEDSRLRGKTVIFLGSSVTYGFASRGCSFVEYLAVKDGIRPIKEAVNGTTLVTLDGSSYIPRMEQLPKTEKADAFVCQLSTNDARLQLPLGQVSADFNRSSFERNTVAGAIEYIISYASDTWHCPVAFYTGTVYDNEHYAKMVSLLHEIAKKWDITVIDLWNNAGLNGISDKQKKLYILPDGVHPTMAGYRDWWLPAFEAGLEGMFRAG